MASSKNDIRAWLHAPAAKENDRMIVVCDTYDYVDFPVYCEDAAFGREMQRLQGGMNRIMEVYDLKGDLEAQLAERVAYHPPSVTPK